MPRLRQATHVVLIDRPTPFAAIRLVNGPRCLPMRRMAVRVAGTGSDVPAINAVSVRPAGSRSGVGTRIRLNTGDAKRSVISSLSGKRCRACRLSPTAMLTWSWRRRWFTGWISAACSHADAINAS